MNDCIIGIGSNLDAEVHIPAMLRLLRAAVEVVDVSEMVQTKPIGITEQPDYTNGAARIRTTMDLESFRVFLKKLEDDLGRNRNEEKYGPRIIDLDIMIWNNVVIDVDYFTRDFLRNAAEELGFKNEC